MSGIEPRGGRLKGDYFTISCSFSSIANGDFFFLPWSAFTGGTGTETENDMTTDFGFMVRRLRVVLTSNSATGSSIISFRVNGATPAGLSRTFLTTVTGESASGVVSHNVAAGDTISFRCNVTDAAANTISGMAYVTCQRVTE